MPVRRSIKSFLRNLVCSLLAILLILTGRVRRARMRAAEGDIASAIYFHKPDPGLFTRCLDWLAKHRYTFISAGQLEAALEGRTPFPKRAVWLSMDDGCTELLNTVLPLVKSRNIPVTLFIPSGIAAGGGRFPWVRDGAPERRHCMTVSELKQVSLYPEVTIGSHTVRHADTTACSPEEIRFEVGQSQLSLEEWTGKTIRYFAYPFGRFNGCEKPWLRDFDYRLAATTVNAFVTPQSDPYAIPRFSVGDNIWFPEAVCNMVGVWRPVMDRIKATGELLRIRGARRPKRSGAQAHSAASPR